MKYLLLLAKTLIYRYVKKFTYHGLIPFKQYTNHIFFDTKQLIKVYHGIINFNFTIRQNQ